MNNDLLWARYLRSLKRKRRSALTIRNYEKSMRLFRRYLEERSLIEVSRDELESFFDERLDQVLASTVHGDYVNLRAFYNWLVAEEYLATSPMLKIDAPEFEYKVPRILSDQELKSLFQACKGTRFYDRRDEAMIRLMSEIGGPRRAEITNLMLADIDFRHDLVHLQGKTGERWIPYSDKTADALDRYLRLREKSRFAELPNVWLSYRGAVPIQTIWWVIQRRSEQAGIGKIHPHTLRHTAAHRAKVAGMSEQDMETLFGWAPGSMMTRAYGRAGKVVRAQNASRKLGLGNSL